MSELATVGRARGQRRWMPDWLGSRRGAFVAAYVLAFWFLVWGGINAGSWPTPRQTTLGTLMAYRSLAPILAGLAAAVLLARSRWAWKRFHVVDPYLPLLAYAGVGAAAAILMLPHDTAMSLYWAVAFISAILVVRMLDASRHGLQDATLLLRMTWAIVVIVALILVIQGVIRFDLVGDTLAGFASRLYGTYPEPFVEAFLINANGAARFAAVGLLIILIQLTMPASRTRRSVLLILSVLMFVLLMSTKSRGAMTAFALAAVLAGVLRWGVGRRQAIPAVLALAAAGFWFRDFLAEVYLRGFGHGYFLSGRTLHWASDFELIRESPYIGWGFYSDHILGYPHAHNAVVQSLMHGGLVGGFLFVAAWVLTWGLLFQAGLRNRFRHASPAQRAHLIEAAAVLFFLMVRSIVESTGAFYGIDLLLWLTVVAYVRAYHFSPSRPGTAAPDGHEKPAERIRVLVTAPVVPPHPQLLRASTGPRRATPRTAGGDSWWSILGQPGRNREVWVLTDGVSAAASPRRSPGRSQGALRVVAVDLPRPFRILRRQRTMFIYSLMWFAVAYWVARDLHTRKPFDLHHHLVTSRSWAPSLAELLIPVPHLRGPISIAQLADSRTDHDSKTPLAGSWALARHGNTFWLMIGASNGAGLHNGSSPWPPSSGSSTTPMDGIGRPRPIPMKRGSARPANGSPSTPPFGGLELSWLRGLLPRAYATMKANGRVSGRRIRHVPVLDVLGTPVSAVTMPQTLEYVDRAVRSGSKTLVCVCSVNNVITARADAKLREIHGGAGLCLPDGWPLARAVRGAIPTMSGRIRGRDLVSALAKQSARKGHSLFLFGAGPEVAQTMACKLQIRYPGLRIAGAITPPFRPPTRKEDRRFVRQINAARPDIVLVGLPTPLQEKWMWAHRHRIPARVLIGVGAAFDFVAGSKRPAPTWVSDHGLEWLWRFAQEPRRLWRRVLLQGPQFTGLMALEALRGRRRRGAFATIAQGPATVPVQPANRPRTART